MKSFVDQTVVVSGAGSGMGRAYALEAARRGARLALSDLDPNTLEETCALLPTGTECLVADHDVADREAVYAFAETVRSELGGADVVINNAGVEGALRPVWALTDAELARNLDVNFWGVVHGTRAFLPQLLDGHRGALVNVSCVSGLIGVPNHADYCAAKFAVRGFTEAVAAELLHTHVRVHLVHPAGVATNAVQGEGDRSLARRYLRARPSDVANEVLDAVGTRRSRIVVGHGGTSTSLTARVLPQRVLSRMVWSQLAWLIDNRHYPATSDRALAGGAYPPAELTAGP